MHCISTVTSVNGTDPAGPTCLKEAAAAKINRWLASFNIFFDELWYQALAGGSVQQVDISSRVGVPLRTSKQRATNLSPNLDKTMTIFFVGMLHACMHPYFRGNSGA